VPEPGAASAVVGRQLLRAAERRSAASEQVRATRVGTAVVVEIRAHHCAVGVQVDGAAKPIVGGAIEPLR
jgi:hypothetical protein